LFNKVAFIGAGSMAEAIISGIITTSFLKKEQIFVMNKNNKERLENLSERYEIHCDFNKKQLVAGADLIILSMKPHDAQEAIDSMKDYIQEDQLIISILAGVSTDYIAKLIGKEIPIIRAMPNTSASIGLSATAVTKGENASEEHLQKAVSLFNTIGTTSIVKEEEMHTVTGISGSGPAYFYYVVEAMQKAASEAGLDQLVASELITQTIVGAGEMLKQSGETASTLREKITSPNGTTQAAIETLDEYNVEKAMMDCVKNAKERSIELGKLM